MSADTPLWVSVLIIAIYLIDRFLLKRWTDAVIEQRIKSRFEKELETHKSSLLLIAEHAKFEYQRRLHDAALFVSRQHEAYAQLYAKVLTADGDIRGLFGTVTATPTFQDFEEADLADFLKAMQISQRGQREVLGAFAAGDLRAAISTYEKYHRIVAVFTAERAFNDAKNYSLTNAIYLSRDVAPLVRTLLKQLYQVLLAAQMGESHRYPGFDAVDKEIQRIRDELLSLLQQKLQAPDTATSSITSSHT
jgi:hypothetical protein